MKITRKLFVVFGALLLAVFAEAQEKTALEIFPASFAAADLLELEI